MERCYQTSPITGQYELVISPKDIAAESIVFKRRSLPHNAIKKAFKTEDVTAIKLLDAGIMSIRCYIILYSRLWAYINTLRNNMRTYKTMGDFLSTSPDVTKITMKQSK
jgi:hypothetical protein